MAPNVPVMAASIAYYFLSSIALTTYNKWLLANYKFDFPITLIWINTFCTSLLAFAVAHFFMGGVKEDPAWWSKLSWRRILRELLPIALLFSLDTTTTNAAYESMSVPLTEVIKSCIPLVILLVHFHTGRDQPSLATFTVILLLSVGTALTSAADNSFTVNGFLLAIVGMLSGATRFLLLETVLTGAAKIPPILNLLYLSPMSFLALTLPFLWVEYGRLQRSLFFSEHSLHHTCLLLGGLCLLAFSMNLSQMVMIAHTSALTMCVVGVARLMFVIAVSMVVFGYHLTPTNELGVFLSIVGASTYNYLRVTKLRDNMSEDASARASLLRTPPGPIVDVGADSDEDVAELERSTQRLLAAVE